MSLNIKSKFKWNKYCTALKKENSIWKDRIMPGPFKLNRILEDYVKNKEGIKCILGRLE